MILFSSDVSARGMDYPDVTFVLQVPPPPPGASPPPHLMCCCGCRWECQQTARSMCTASGALRALASRGRASCSCATSRATSSTTSRLARTMLLNHAQLLSAAPACQGGSCPLVLMHASSAVAWLQDLPLGECSWV